MTNDPEVIQSDRDAAADYATEAGWGAGSVFAIEGHADMQDDEVRLVQAFARHRLASLPATPSVVEVDRPYEKLSLWFFRDMSSEQRLRLFRLFGLPVNEIGDIEGHQRRALKMVLATLQPNPPAPDREALLTILHKYEKPGSDPSRAHLACEEILSLIGTAGGRS